MIDAVTAPPAAVPADADTTMIVSRPAPDPHASKIPTDHPGLRLRRPPFRVLRRGPILALGMTVAAIFAIALGRGFITPDASADTDVDRQAASQAMPSANLDVADIVKNAPGNNSPINSPKPPAPPATIPIGPARAAETDPRTATLNQALNSAPPATPAAEKPTPTTPSPEQEARRQELERARGAGLFFAGGDSETNDRPPTANTPATTVTATANQPPTTRPAASAADQDPNAQVAKNTFMDDTAKDHITSNSSPLTQPMSPFEVKAGSIIPTTLITGIDSDLPGEVVAQVRENVYDSVSGAYLLIPQGSRLLARYDSAVTYGQERVLLCWKRLIRPDGSSVDLECAPGVDLAGQAGFADQVDNHWFRLITGVVLSSLLGAVTQSATGSVDGYRPTLAQNFTAGAATEFASAGQQITRRNLGLQPTVKIRPGYSVNVLVNKDLVVPPYRSRFP